MNYRKVYDQPNYNRNAGILEREGLVIRKQGKGTVVKEPKLPKT